MPKKGRRRKQGRRPDQETKNRDLSPRGDQQSPRGTEQANGSWKFHAAALLIICSLGAAIYSNTLGGVFIFDDEHNITENPYITRVTELDGQRLYEAGFKSPLTRPVANISFALNHYFGGLDVTGYHCVNIAIHLACGILVYFLASVTFRLFFRLEPHDTAPVSDRAIGWMALFGACLFVAHPLQTQAITYIVQRMTSMATMFYLLALLLYIYGRLSGSIRRRWVLWTGCLISWLLAMGSKEIAITLPPLLLLYEWYFFQDLSKAWLRGSLKYLLPLAVVMVVVALLFLGTSPWDRIASGYDRRDFTLGERVLTQPRVVIHYISLLACPLPSRLNLLHHVSTSRSLFEPITTLFSFLTIAGLMGLAVYLARRQRLLSFCLLWFFLNLALESSVIALEMVFEHRLYLPMFAFALAVPYGVYCLLSKRVAVAGLLGVVVIVGLGTGTYVRNRVWQDEIALWTDVVDKNPLAHRAHFYLGNALAGQGNVVEAIEHFRQALRINPDYARAHNNLGNALASQGNVVEAIKYYRDALRIYPDYVGAHNNLGNALAVQGKVVEAIEHFRQALRIDPDYVGAHNNLGNALAGQGNVVEAIEHYRQALRINSGNAGAHNNLGNVLRGQGKLEEAIKHYQEALRIEPDYAGTHSNLGIALVGQGKLEEAIEHFRQVLRINPDYARAHNNLGIVLGMLAASYAEAGRLDEAIKTASEAIVAATAAGNEKLARNLRRQAASYRQAVAPRKPIE